MSRRTFLDENNEEKEVIHKLDECRYKVNGRCYNNFTAGHLRLGKRCYEIGDGKYCTHFVYEEIIDNDNNK